MLQFIFCYPASINIVLEIIILLQFGLFLSTTIYTTYEKPCMILMNNMLNKDQPFISDITEGYFQIKLEYIFKDS